MKDLMVVALVFGLLCFTVNAKHRSEQQAEYVILFDPGSQWNPYVNLPVPGKRKILKSL